MEIIPVMDLMDGIVVHAREGNREQYRPICTPLCPNPAPVNVLSAFMEVYPFHTVYVADLNSIQGNGNHTRVLDELRRSFRRVQFWLDAGRSSLDLSAPRVRPVVGTETDIAVEELEQLASTNSNIVLSLDFSGRRLLGDPRVLKSPESWPAEVIVMNLRRVGTRHGPALQLARRIMQLAGGRRTYVAGGVRNTADLHALKNDRVSGALVATALHDRSLDRVAIGEMYRQQKKPPA